MNSGLFILTKSHYSRKKGASKFIYLLLFRCFERYYQFPASLENVPNTLIFAGLNLFNESVNQQELIEFFQKKEPLIVMKKRLNNIFAAHALILIVLSFKRYYIVTFSKKRMMNR